MIRITIPKLREDGTNWGIYVHMMESYIIASEKPFRRHLLGQVKSPQRPKAARGEEESFARCIARIQLDNTRIDDDSAELEKYEEKLDEYERIESSIRSIILCSIPEKIQYKLIAEGSQSAKTMWGNLKRIYEGSDAKEDGLYIQSIEKQLYAIAIGSKSTTTTTGTAGSENQNHNSHPDSDPEPMKKLNVLLSKANEYASVGGILTGLDPNHILARTMEVGSGEYGHVYESMLTEYVFEGCEWSFQEQIRFLQDGIERHQQKERERKMKAAREARRRTKKTAVKTRGYAHSDDFEY